LEEIKEINQRLIDTVVEISDDEDAADPSEVAISSIGCEGTTVRFSFIAVSLSPALKAHLSSTQMVNMVISLTLTFCETKYFIYPFL